jgi:hypothetical protein
MSNIELIAELKKETRLMREAYDRLKEVLPKDGNLSSGQACRLLNCGRSHLAKLAKKHAIKNDKGKYILEELMKIKSL